MSDAMSGGGRAVGDYQLRLAAVEREGTARLRTNALGLLGLTILVAGRALVFTPLVAG